MKTLIDQIKNKNPDLKKAEIEGLLFLISSSQEVSNSELIRLTGLPKETLRIFKSTSASILEDRRDDVIKLNSTGMQELEGEKPKPYKWSLTDYKDTALEQKLKDIRQKYHLLPKREYDQFFATEETSVAKAMMLHDKGLVAGKNIVLLGDDDLVSIVLGLIDDTYYSITVLDVDRDILSVIETIAKDMGIQNIRTRYFDAREELPKDLTAAFDVAVTDPPYTRNGVALFLNNCIRLISGSKGSKNDHIVLFYGNSFKSPEKTLKVQEVISSYNLLIEDKIDKFARYYGAESIGSASSLYILKTTPYTGPSDIPIGQESVYTHQEQKEDRFPFVDHYTLKLYNVPLNIVSSKKAMLKAMEEFCAAHRLKVVDTKVTQFKGQGLSLTYILSNSNLLVHTWPELNAVHMDLITCSPIYNKEFLGKSASDLFSTSAVDIRKVE